mmetsp:Transcript_80784/g.121415  ORF Transcript_80784/g.121415 Transcript_80784/m.121415 type:complete len:178 (-) Transcript_80784:62-595(-)
MDADHHMAMLWTALAELEDEKKEAQGAGRKVPGWFQLKGWHFGALFIWMTEHNMQHRLKDLVIKLPQLRHAPHALLSSPLARQAEMRPASPGSQVRHSWASGGSQGGHAWKGRGQAGVEQEKECAADHERRQDIQPRKRKVFMDARTGKRCAETLRGPSACMNPWPSAMQHPPTSRA